MNCKYRREAHVENLRVRGPHFFYRLRTGVDGAEELERVGATISIIFVSRANSTSVRRRVRTLAGAIVGVAATVLISGLPVVAQSQSSPTPNAAQNIAPLTSTAPQSPDNQATGSIVGKVVDQRGTPVYGAHVTLARGGTPPVASDTDEDGQFSFANVAPGPFQLSVTASDFKPAAISGVLKPGEYHSMPAIALVLAPVVTQVVVKPQSVIAQEQVKQEEQQRVMGVFPNFYVTYLPNPAPLDAHQKFQLASKSIFDPVTFIIVGAAAGLEQIDGQYSGFGTGPAGYAKRYGAAYADVSIGTFLGDAVFPSLFKQDPRFFYKANGTVRSRILYALAASVLAKGDNGHWQPDYSNFLGDLASGGISNLYYPPQDRNGVALTFENMAIGTGARAAGNLMEEFVVPKLEGLSLKPHVPFVHHFLGHS